MAGEPTPSRDAARLYDVRGRSGNLATAVEKEAAEALARVSGGTVVPHGQEIESAARNDVGPHEFVPLRRPAISDNARCRACYVPKWAHPVKGWVASRPLGDRSPAIKNGVVKGAA